VQQEFTSLLRETCSPSPSVTVGAAVSNDPRATAGVSRGRSTEGNEPGKTGRTHNSGRAELGRQTRPSMVLTWSDEADWLSSSAATTVAEKECCSIRQGLPGTAVRGPACTVVWEAGGATLPPTRFDAFIFAQGSSHAAAATGSALDPARCGEHSVGQEPHFTS